VKKRCPAGFDNLHELGGGFFANALACINGYGYDRCRRPVGHETNEHDPHAAWHFPECGSAMRIDEHGELIIVNTQDWIDWYTIVEQTDDWNDEKEETNVPNNVKTNNPETRKYGVQMSVMKAIETNGMKITYVDDLMRQLGLSKIQVQSAINHIIKRNAPGHCIEVVTRGTIWRWNPGSPTRPSEDTPVEATVTPVDQPTLSTRGVQPRGQLVAEQVQHRPATVFPVGSMTHLDVVRKLNDNSLLCEDVDGDLWIAKPVKF
jgi:hypothetical protein